MFKPKIALLGILALFIASGITASVASANGPAWKVSGSRLGAQVKQQIKLLSGPTTLVATVTMLEAKIKCGTSRANNAYIEGNGQGAGLGGASSITYVQCEVAAPFAGCKVVEPITTSPIKGQLVTIANGQQIDELIQPTQGTKFVTLAFEKKGGAECALPEIEVKGSVAALVKPEGEETKTGGELEFPATPIKEIKKEGGATEEIGLFLGTEKAKFSGKYGSRLVSEESFGAFH